MAAAAAIPAVVGAVANLGSNIIGDSAARMNDAERERLLRMGIEAFREIPLPVLEQMMAEQLGPSAVAGVETNPALEEAQMKALRRLIEVGDSGGLLLSDKAALNAIQNDISARNSSQQAAIMDNMAARGVGGSGAELAALLSAQQGAANRRNQAGLDIAGRAQQRALDAYIRGGELGGRVRGQEFAEGVTRGRASDARDAWNAGSRQAAQNYNLGLPQQHFGNQLQKARGMTGQLGQMGNYQAEQGQRTRNMGAGIGNAFNEAGIAASNYWMDEEEKRR